MDSLTQIVLGASVGEVVLGKKLGNRAMLWGAIAGTIPDLDVIGNIFMDEINSLAFHRGITHSISFSLLFGLLLTRICYPKTALLSKTGILYSLYFALCTLSHALLDAMTTGGLGVAFFAPFENSRYFLPWREIQVSPIGASKFFSEWGLRVIKSELIWIGIPSLILLALGFIRQKVWGKHAEASQ